MTSGEIDGVVSESASESHSLYAVDAQLMDELKPDLVITQDLCEVCAASSGDLATACPIGTEVFSMNPRSLDDVVESVITLPDPLGVHDRGVAVAAATRATTEAVRATVAALERPRVFAGGGAGGRGMGVCGGWGGSRASVWLAGGRRRALATCRRPGAPQA